MIAGGPPLEVGVIGHDLAWPLRRAVDLFGEREAVVDGPTRLSYREFAVRVTELARGLLELGAQPGDRIGILSANTSDYLAAYFAVPAFGLVLVPLNQRLSDTELAAIIEDCTPVIILTDVELLTRATNVAPSSVVVRTTRDVVASSCGASIELEHGGLSGRVAAIFYTGGTTGRAKGVTLTHSALSANALHMVIGLGYRASDTYLHCAPMFHLGDGMSVHPMTWVGGRHVIVPRFEPSAVVEAIVDERVTCVFLVPAMLTLLVEHLEASTTAPPDLSSLRLVVHGGAPIAPTLLERAMARLGCSFTQSYGMTEAGPILSLLPNEERRLDSPTVASAGQPVIGVEVRIVRADGTECPPGEVGEIAGRGPNFATGYWGQPELTAERFGNGWYRSGDLAYFDEERYLYIVGRTSEIIISGGENVYAAEVESALASHPEVIEAAVVAVPSDRWGEQVHAALVLRPGARATDEELEAHCRSRIAAYKVPRSWERHALLPRTGAGKIDKLAIRAPHWAGSTKQVS